ALRLPLCILGCTVLPVPFLDTLLLFYYIFVGGLCQVLLYYIKAMKKLKKNFFSKLAKLHKRNNDRPQMYNLKGITSDGKVVEFPHISADKCGVINIKGLPVGTYKFTEVINGTQQ
uniref:hypothetical protein n=1 Tax=Ruminococcus bicirculans (ex Wegman et al. 2014) TaxID=1160721 RepID=UPI003FEE6D2D